MKKIRKALLIFHSLILTGITLLMFFVFPVSFIQNGLSSETKVFASVSSGLPAPFRDLPDDPMYRSYIEDFQKENIIIGDTVGGSPIGSLRPYDPVQRDEFTKVAVLIRLLESQAGLNPPGQGLNEFTLRINTLLIPYYKSVKGAVSFSDVPPKPENCAKDPSGCSPWYTQYINYASGKGMIKGYPDNTFRPGDTVLRIHALKLIMAENGDIPADSDSRFIRLSSDPRIKNVKTPKCLDGAEPYILDNNGGSSPDTDNLLSYAMLADKLDLFGNECQLFTQAGKNTPVQRADYLNQPLKRGEIARFFALTTEYAPVSADHTDNTTTDLASEYFAPSVGTDDIREERAPPQVTEAYTRKRAEITRTPEREIEIINIGLTEPVKRTGIKECGYIATDRANSRLRILDCIKKLRDIGKSETEIDAVLKQYGLWDLAEDTGNSVTEEKKNTISEIIRQWEESQPEEYFAYTGKVKTNDNILSVTARLNKYYGTKYSYMDIARINGITNYSDIKGKTIRIGTLDGWQPPEDPDVIDTDYWDDLTVEKQKILHYNRNAYQITLLPEDLDEMIKDQEITIGSMTINVSEWKSLGEAAAHNVGTSGNSDYRGLGKRKGQQAIYDWQGNLVTTPENMGTYDYEEPSILNLYKNHYKVDVIPWLIWGNSPQDSTTYQERLDSFASEKKMILLEFLYGE